LKLNKKALTTLVRLLEGEVIEGKELSKKEPFKFLKTNGAITLERKSAQREKAYLQKEQNLFLALKSRGYNLHTKEDIIQMIERFDEVQNRAQIQKTHNSTKAKKSPSLKGLFLSSLYDVAIKLDEKELTISPNSGMGYFIFHTQKVELPQEMIIVGVENYQVVWFAQKYAKFYKSKNILFVYISPYFLEWIESQENEYIHFGDYDLAGVTIYANRVVPHLKKCKQHSFFIPSNIEELIKNYGNAKLYQKQQRYLKTPLHNRTLEELREVMKKYKKVLEQEGIGFYDK